MPSTASGKKSSTCKMRRRVVKYITSSSRELKDGSSVSYRTGVKTTSLSDYSESELRDHPRSIDKKRSKEKKAQKREPEVKSKKGKSKAKRVVTSSDEDDDSSDSG